MRASADDCTRMVDVLDGNVQTIAQRTRDETARLFGSLEASLKKPTG